MNRLTATLAIALTCLILVSTACTAEHDKPTRDELMTRKMQPRDDAAKADAERLAADVMKPVTGVEHDVPSDLLDRIAEDAAKRAKVEPGNVRIVAAQAATWPDGAMGCPEPGAVYTQVQTRGYHVIATVGLQKFDYRAGLNGRFRLCELPLGKKPLPAQ